MTAEELLKPRYKVMADYPAAMHSVGDVLSAYENGIRYLVEINENSEKYSMNDYPHLFKKLEWWEERELKDMPEFLKYNIDEENYVVKVYKWDMEKLFGYMDDDLTTGFDLNLWQKEPYLPSTKEEYEQYQKHSL